MPSLTAESSQLLEQLSELESALQMAPNERAPGSDGLPSEFFKIYKDTVLLPLIAVFQEAVEVGCLLSSM